MRQTPNGKQVPVNVVGSSTFGRYSKISPAQTDNMFESDQWLINTPGYQKIQQLVGEGQGRAIYKSTRGNKIMVVVNASVYLLDANLDATLQGTIATQVGEVTIAENLNAQICLVDGTGVYICNYLLPSPNLTQQTPSGLGTLIPNYVTYHNTFFLFGNNNITSNGAAWYAYQYLSPTLITIATPGQFALQTKADFALAITRLPGQGNNVLALGSTVGEIWNQRGGLQNYVRNPTISIDYGVASVSTIAECEDYVAFLAVNEFNSRVIGVYTKQGFKRISTYGIDYKLSQVQRVDLSTGMFFRQDGHLFYQLTFYWPNDNFTLLYDFNTEKFYNLKDGQGNCHPARNYIQFNGKTYFVGINSPALYESSTNYTTYNENVLSANAQDASINYEIPRLRICDTIRNEDSSQFRPNSYVLTIEQGCDPLVSGISRLNNADPIQTEDGNNPPAADLQVEYGPAFEMEDAGLGPGLPGVGGRVPYQPRVDLSVSRDGGITWSNWVGRNLNPVGNRQNILNWEGMGLCNSLTIKHRFIGISRCIVGPATLEIF